MASPALHRWAEPGQPLRLVEALTTQFLAWCAARLTARGATVPLRDRHALGCA